LPPPERYSFGECLRADFEGANEAAGIHRACRGGGRGLAGRGACAQPALSVNLKTAKALGLYALATLLASAYKVIE
jgi:hypothetical protein